MSDRFRVLIVLIFFCLSWMESCAENKTTTESKVKYFKIYPTKIQNNELMHMKKIWQRTKERSVAEHKQLKRKNNNKIQPRMESRNLLFDKNYLHRSRETSPDNDEILSPYAILTQMEQILKHFKNINVTQEILGRTVEYNDIVLFKISSTKSDALSFRAKDNKYIDEVPQKKIIFIVHGLAVMGIRMVECLKTLDKLSKLISYYLEHLDHFDIYLIPMANPDGYVMVGRLGVWNKNRSPQADCAGVMLDRNFDVAWNNTQHLSSCGQYYPGPIPFSEAETRAIRDVFHYHGHKIIAYIHVHPGSYDENVFKGDAILYPRGFTDAQSDDDRYIDLKGEVDEAMKNASFSVVSITVDSLYNWYGPVSGASVDYASTVYGIPFAMEFIMQIYEDDILANRDEARLDYMALTQIWSRLIDVVFKYLWKFLNNTNNDVKK